MTYLDSLGAITEELTGPKANDQPQVFLRQVIVQSVQGGTVTIRAAGDTTDIPGVKYTGTVPIAGKSVMALQYERQYLVIGGKDDENATARGLIAYMIIDTFNKRGTGRNLGVNSSDLPETLIVTTAQQAIGLYCNNIPIVGNRLIRARWHFPAMQQSPTDRTSNDVYLIMMAWFDSASSGTWQKWGESRHGGQGNASPSPEGEVVFVSPAGATIMGLGIDTQTLGSTATLYRYVNVSPYLRTHLTIEDLGSP